MLGDNIFAAHALVELPSRAAAEAQGASVFAYQVNDPGTLWCGARFDAEGRALSLEENPPSLSLFAVTGPVFL